MGEVKMKMMKILCTVNTANKIQDIYIGFIDNPKDNLIEAPSEIIKNTDRWYYENGDFVYYPQIKISADKQRISTTETCIITAEIIPPIGKTLKEEEIVFRVDDMEYRILTENGIAQIQYSNENIGIHRVAVLSTTKYGHNFIEIEVVE